MSNTPREASSSRRATVSHEHHDLYAVPRHSRVRAHATHTHTPPTRTRTRTCTCTCAHVRTRARLAPRSSSAHRLLSLPSAAVGTTPVPLAHTPAACIACRRHHHLSALRSLSQAWQPQGLGQGGHWRRQLVQADDEELRQVSALAWAATVLCSGVPRSRSRPRTPHRVAVCCCTVHLLLALAQRCACEVIPCWAAACLVCSV